MEALRQAAAQFLETELSRSGWRLKTEPNQIKAWRPGWPVQVYSLIHFGDEDSASVMALVIDLGQMPLTGERFRDVFNGDREELLRGLLRFRARQQMNNGAWAPQMGDRAFLSGLNPGIRPSARLVVLDVCPTECGDALALRFIAEGGRFLQAGNAIAQTLARIYLPEALDTEAPLVRLPSTVPVGMPSVRPETDASYPWPG